MLIRGARFTSARTGCGDAGLRCPCFHQTVKSPDGTHESPDRSGLAGKESACPGCGVVLPRSDWPGEAKNTASPECLEIAGQLLGYEVEHAARLGYLHQLRIDAYGAQHISPDAPRIGPVFALNGL
jgi:hypothetical protein